MEAVDADYESRLQFPDHSKKYEATEECRAFGFVRRTCQACRAGMHQTDTALIPVAQPSRRKEGGILVYQVCATYTNLSFFLSTGWRLGSRDALERFGFRGI